MERNFYLQLRKVEDKHWWFVGRRTIIKHMLLSIDLPKKTRILDVGCGTGGNLSLLREFGEVIGVEHDNQAVEIARTRELCKIYRGSLPDRMPFSTQKFDLAVLLDVLEHIDNDLASLKKIYSLLNPFAYLIITTSAFPFLWSQYDVQCHHKRRYSYSILKNILEETGFKIERLSFYNTWIFPIIATERLLRRLFPSKNVCSDLRLPLP